MPRSPFPVAAVLLALCGAGNASAASVAERAATCVAALEREAAAMGAQLRQGKTEVEPELTQRLQEGFAFIGLAYKQGLRKEEADRLLEEAKQAQERLPPGELAARQSSCRAEGAKLWAGANIVEQAVLQRAVQRRIAKLKRPVVAPGA